MPDPHLNVSTPQGSPQVPHLVFNREQRLNAGVGILGTDDYNNASMQMYNNAYNYWLWQEQMKYNSPAAQVQRLKEAGLNPNFNSIDGTGNAGSIPTASGGYQSTYGQKHLQAISTGVQVATGLATAVSKGVQALKTFATTPKAIGFYRGLLTRIMGNRYEGSNIANMLNDLELKATGKLMGIDSFGDSLESDYGHVNYDAPFWVKKYGEASFINARAKYQDLLNQVKEWEKDSYNPQKLANLKATYGNIVAGTELRNLEINWKNPKEAMGILRTIIPLFGLLLFHR